MKTTDILYEHIRNLWEEAVSKPFVTEMARGTLSMNRFRYYMLQDYLYLLDYIDILRDILKYTENSGLKKFLCHIIAETRNETERVHVPNMKKIGISDDEIRNCQKADVIKNYVRYMREQLEESGLKAGLTALLQCSWVYAYIGEKMTERYPEEIQRSAYKSWFDSYTCKEYIQANQTWMDVLNRETAKRGPEETKKLCDIFQTCASYENQFWDMLYMD